SEDAPGAVAVDELLLRVVGEVLRRALIAREPDVLPFRHRLIDRVEVDGPADVALVEHLAQNEVAALTGRILVRRRVVRGRILGDAGEQRRLGERQRPRCYRVWEVG